MQIAVVNTPSRGALYETAAGAWNEIITASINNCQRRMETIATPGGGQYDVTPLSRDDSW